MTLRDGSTPLDPRLDLIARKPDPRDWPVADILAEGKLVSKRWECKAHLNQGSGQLLREDFLNLLVHP